MVALRSKKAKLLKFFLKLESQVSNHPPIVSSSAQKTGAADLRPEKILTIINFNLTLSFSNLF
jgi:hypothetical protein